MNRPELTDAISIQNFQDFYWLKEELVTFCRAKGIKHSGGKMEIADRISNYLATGQISKPSVKTVPKASSRFDWNNEILTVDTILTDNYKNSENVRSFFLKHIGTHFHFTVAFMKWTKQNAGMTLNDALTEWKRLHELKKDKNFLTEIAPQFEYNRYMRSFLADNPGKQTKDAMKYWKLKREIPGSNAYAKTDLDLD